MALEGPEGDQLGAGQHGLEGVGHGVQDQRVEGAVRPEGRHVHRTALVNADGHVELLGGLPHHVVDAVGERAAQAGIGPDEARHQAELVDAAPELARRRHRVLQGEHGRPEEPARVGGAVPGQPLVVGGRQDHGRGGVLEEREVQPDGRVQHRLVDAFAVHVAQPGGRVRPARLGVGQRAERRGVVEARTRTGQVAQRHRQQLGVADHDVLVTGAVGADAGPVPVGQPCPGRLRFDHVTVGVDDRAGARWERTTALPAHVDGMRQSSTSGSRWRKRRLAFPPATARSSSSGSEPHVAASTACVSGHDESACG